MKKKIRLIILCFIMAMGLIQVSGMTASAETYSGSCGENMTWSLDADTKTLTISGSGKMDNFPYYGYSPWTKYEYIIENVIIENGVENIGKRAFAKNENMVKITIPDSVTSIGAESFQNCFSLEDIRIPDSVKNIDSGAFYKCVNFKNVTIGSNVETIDRLAFWFCEGLMSVEIPASVINIVDGAFLDCINLERFNVDENNQYYASYDGDLYNKYMTTLIKYPSAKAGEYIIPNSVKNINKTAFCDDSNLEIITIHESIESIDFKVLDNCKKLSAINVDINNLNYSSDDGVLFNKDKTILIGCPRGKTGEYVIPDSVINFDTPAFTGCNKIQSIMLPKSLTSIGELAFYDCYNLRSIIIPDSVTSIGDFAFSDCTSLSNVTIGDSVTSIGMCAFSDCPSLSNVTIGNSVTSIEDYAFENCTILTQLNMGNSVTDIGYCAFRGCTYLYKVTIGDSLESIGEYAFSDCVMLNEVTMGDMVKSIGKCAFYGCENLRSITIPNLVTTIESETFSSCKKLKNITIGNSVTSIGDKAFFYCVDLERLVLPNSLTSIGDSAFNGCQNISDITMGDLVTNIGRGAFYDCYSIYEVFYAGSKDDIEKIMIDEHNENLVNAFWNYADIEDPIYIEIINFDFGKGNNTINGYIEYNVIAKDVPYTGEVIMAIYDSNGTLIQVSKSGVYDINKGHNLGSFRDIKIPYNIRSGDYEIKLFLWDSIESMKPLAEDSGTLYI